MSEGRKLEMCFICGVYRHCEQHHVIPGDNAFVVPLCLSCHEHLDRTPLDNWDIVETVAGIMDCWDKLDKRGRIWLFKVISLAARMKK